MGVQAVEPRKANGLATALNVIASPKEAFETLRDIPMWGWAFIIAIVLGLIGMLLEGPASRHASVAFLAHMQQTNPTFAAMSDAVKQKQLHDAANPPAWQQIFGFVTLICVTLITALLNAVLLLIGNAIGRGQADFKRLWCASMNIAVPTIGIAAVVLGLITLLRGADSFNSIGDLAHALPGLGMLAPGITGLLGGFLSAITIFSIWGLFLNAGALQIIARTSKGLAYGVAIVILVLGALMQGASAALFHF
ncbi:MAG TPA: YIP1 family protein [Candidatus Baltobacteraceae bacterium]|jgi:hypothetical protein